jgi:hypothetical protein
MMRVPLFYPFFFFMLLSWIFMWERAIIVSMSRGMMVWPGLGLGVLLLASLICERFEACSLWRVLWTHSEETRWVVLPGKTPVLIVPFYANINVGVVSSDYSF